MISRLGKKSGRIRTHDRCFIRFNRCPATRDSENPGNRSWQNQSERMKGPRFFGASKDSSILRLIFVPLKSDWFFMTGGRWWPHLRDKWFHRTLSNSEPISLFDFMSPGDHKVWNESARLTTAWSMWVFAIEGGRLNSTEVAHLLLTRQPRVWFSAFSRILLQMLLIFLMALLRTLDRGLKMSIKPNLF